MSPAGGPAGPPVTWTSSHDGSDSRATGMRRGIDYSCAVALSKIDRWEEHKRTLSFIHKAEKRKARVSAAVNGALAPLA